MLAPAVIILLGLSIVPVIYLFYTALTAEPVPGGPPEFRRAGQLHLPAFAAHLPVDRVAHLPACAGGARARTGHRLSPGGARLPPARTTRHGSGSDHSDDADPDRADRRRTDVALHVQRRFRRHQLPAWTRRHRAAGMAVRPALAFGRSPRSTSGSGRPSSSS